MASFSVRLNVQGISLLPRRADIFGVENKHEEKIKTVARVLGHKPKLH